MAKDLFWTITTFAIISAVLVLSFWPADKSSVVVVKYDCSALSTDAPAQVQEACKKREKQ